MLPISSTAVRLGIASVTLAAAAVGTVSIGSSAHADPTVTPTAAATATATPTPTPTATSTPTSTPTSTSTATATATTTATATPTAPAPTTISIRALKSRIDPGKSDTVTGNLNVRGVADAAGRPVVLEARSAGDSDFTPVGSVVAGPYGGLHLGVEPEATTRYRWVYAGAADAQPSTSGVVSVRVNDRGHHAYRLPTTLSVRAVPRPDAAADLVRGKLRSGRFELRGRQVVLLSRTPGQTTWTYAGIHRTDRVGVARFDVSPATGTAYQLRFLGTTALRPAASGVVGVAPRPVVTITATPTSIDPGATTTVGGVVTSSAGAPLPSTPVDLVARPAGSRAAFHVVTTGLTGADGAVALADAPTRATTYRLRVQQTSASASATSAAVRVDVRAPSSLSILQRTTPTGVEVAGTLRSKGRPARGEVVTLEAQAPGTTTWAPVATATTTRRGGVEFSLALVSGTTVPGTGYRLDFAGTPRLASAISGTVTS